MCVISFNLETNEMHLFNIRKLFSNFVLHLIDWQISIFSVVRRVVSLWLSFSFFENYKFWTKRILKVCSSYIIHDSMTLDKGDFCVIQWT